jgi:hypothetical protein
MARAALKQITERISHDHEETVKIAEVGVSMRHHSRIIAPRRSDIDTSISLSLKGFK